MINSSIWSIDETLTGTTNLGESQPGSNDNERVLHIPQSSNIRWFSVILRICVAGGSYSSTEVLSVYSTAPADII